MLHEGLDFSTAFGLETSTFVLIMTAWLLVLLFFIVVMGAFLFWFVYLNKKAILIETLGIQKWRTTRGRVRKDKDGIERLRLFRSKIDILPPADDNYILSGKTPLVILVKRGNNYLPVKPIIWLKAMDAFGKKGGILGLVMLVCLEKISCTVLGVVIALCASLGS